MATKVTTLLLLFLVVAVNRATSESNPNESNLDDIMEANTTLYECSECHDIYDTCEKLNSTDHNCEKIIIWHACRLNLQY